MDTINALHHSVGEQASSIENILRNAGVRSDEGILETITNSLLDETLRTKSALTGEAAGRLTVENTILNTNLLQLIEDEGLSDNFLNLMEQRGTHSSVVDTVIQGYMGKYLESGQLKIGIADHELVSILESHGETQDVIDRVVQGLRSQGHVKEGAYSAFQKLVRAKAKSGAAITLTTNVRDMSMFSDEAFEFLSKTNQGLERVTLSVGIDEMRAFGLGDSLPESFEGTLRYSNGQFRVGKQVVQEDIARAHMVQVLEDARNNVTESLTLGGDASTGIPGKVRQINTAASKIQNVNITNLQLSQAEEILSQRRSGVTVGTPLASRTLDQQEEALETTSQIFKKQIADTGEIVYGNGQIENYQRLLLERGLPFAGQDVRTRVISTELSKATTDIGEAILTAQGKAPIARNIEAMAEYGFSFAVGQGREGSGAFAKLGMEARDDAKIFSTFVLDDVSNANSRLIIPWEHFRELEINVNGKSLKFGSQEYIESSAYKMHMSMPQLQAKDQDIVNFVFHHQFNNEDEAQAVIRQIHKRVLPNQVELNDFRGTQALSQIQEAILNKTKNPAGLEGVQLSRDQVAKLAMSTREDALDEFGKEVVDAYDAIVAQQARTLMDESTGGIVALSVRGENAAAVKQTFETLAEETSGLGDQPLKTFDMRMVETTEEGAVLRVRNAEADLLAAQISGDVAIAEVGEAAEAERVALQTKLDEEIAKIERQAQQAAEMLPQRQQQLQQVQSQVDDLTTGFSSLDELTGDSLEEYGKLQDEIARISGQIDNANTAIGQKETLLERAQAQYDQDLANIGTTKNVEAKVISDFDDEAQRAWKEAKEIAPKLPKKTRDAIVEAGNRVPTAADPFIQRGFKFMERNRNTILAGAALVGVGLFLAKRKNKQDQEEVFEETLQMGEPQEEQRRFGAQDALLNARRYKTTADPLVTAGVVGNLDRNKIGHHNMSPRKHSHLFRG